MDGGPSKEPAAKKQKVSVNEHDQMQAIGKLRDANVDGLQERRLYAEGKASRKIRQGPVPVESKITLGQQSIEHDEKMGKKERREQTGAKKGQQCGKT